MYEWEGEHPYKRVYIDNMSLKDVDRIIYDYRANGFAVTYLDIKGGIVIFHKRKKAGSGARYRWTERDDRELESLMKAYPKADFIELSARFIPERTPKALRIRARVLGIEPGGRKAHRDTRKVNGDEYEQSIS